MSKFLDQKIESAMSEMLKCATLTPSLDKSPFSLIPLVAVTPLSPLSAQRSSTSEQSKPKDMLKLGLPRVPSLSGAVTKKVIPIAFISGPLEIDAAYFDTHYAPRIREAISQGHRFIIGPSRGIDTFALHYLRKSGVPASRIRLYFNTSEETRLKPIFKRFEESGGRVVVVKGDHTQRDEAMTRASHYDILRYRTEEECRALYGASYRTRVSGTEKNEVRRKSGIGLVLPPGAMSTPLQDLKK
ncbi:hypothetical protein BDZ97DRAFT_1752386 [Flammula alnicola]|nr:hypothetical protein BDZ97DRAFT_1752386 [Flammula alnicola]